MKTAVGIAAALALFVSVARADDGAAVDESPITISPNPQIDENLFLVRAIEETYGSWPRDSVDRNTLQSWLVETRGRVSRLRAVIRVRQLDPDLGTMYDDCLQLIDTYQTYVANVGAIDNAAVQQAENDASAANRTALSDGYDAARHASENGATTSQSIGNGFVAGIIGGAIENYQRSQARDAATNDALDAEGRKVNSAWDDTRSNAEELAERLTKNHGWGVGEAGFDRFTSNQMSDYFKRRPRDPFLLVANAQIRTKTETPADIMNDARTCLDAARQVPEGSAFDYYREQFVADAGYVSLQASTNQLTNSAYSSGPASSAPEAIRISKTLLALDPADESGTGNMLLARALACAGRFDDAIGAANKASEQGRSDPGFCYRYARLMSLTHQVDLAGDWLASAYSRGFHDLAFVRADKDLDNFRNNAANRYSALTTVTVGGEVKWGILNDDVVVTNTSPFSLNNITIHVVLTKDGQTWSPSETLPSLAPGESHTFENIFSISGSRFDTFQTTLSADEGNTADWEP